MSSRKQNIRIRGAVKVLDSQSNTTLGVTRNISLGGIYLITETEFEPDQQLEIRIQYRYWNVNLRAQIVHKQPDGVGLQFLNAEDYEEEIGWIIDSLLADGAWYDDRRKNIRNEVSGPVIWRFKNEDIESNLRNLSLDGAFLDFDHTADSNEFSDLPPSPGATLLLYLPGVHEESEALGCQAAVVHQQPDGIGIRFIDPSDEFIQAIEKILKKLEQKN